MCQTDIVNNATLYLSIQRQALTIAEISYNIPSIYGNTSPVLSCHESFLHHQLYLSWFVFFTKQELVRSLPCGSGLDIAVQAHRTQGRWQDGQQVLVVIGDGLAEAIGQGALRPVRLDLTVGDPQHNAELVGTC